MSFSRPWHSSYAPGVPPEIDPEKITVAEALTRTADKYPTRTALVYLGKRITYRELEKLVNRFPRALLDLGVQPGDIVALLLPNLPQLVIANEAISRAGAVTAMNNPLYTEPELEHQLNDSEARFLITLDLLLPRALKLREKTKIEAIITHANISSVVQQFRAWFPDLKDGEESLLGIYPIFDSARGETIKAYVVVKPGESLTEDEVILFCREKLAAFKVPKSISFTEALPKSAVGKVLRRELRALETDPSRA